MKYEYLLLLVLLIGCHRPEYRIEDQVVSVDPDSDGAFHDIGNVVGNKDIVILGESQHGDGKTLELKSHLLNYLVEEKGFNTIALEGRGFLDMEILNSNTALDTLANDLSKQSLLSWYAGDQQEMLNRTILNNDINFIGLEGYSYFISRLPDALIDYMKKFLKINYNYGDNLPWKEIKRIHYNLSYSNVDDISEEEIDFYTQHLSSIITATESLPESGNPEILEKEIALQSIKNAKEYSILFKHMWHFEDEINYTAYNNLRDQQMALNLIWHKERNPDAKIIIWTANFHGAKKIQDVRYKEDNPTGYDNTVLLGEHLHNNFGDQLYSLAFTSSRGETAMLGQEPKKVNAPEGSLEKELENDGIMFGFIDFSEIRSSYPKLSDEIFNATILGHDNKPGKWLNVFDGIFFIQENERIPSVNQN